MPCPGRYVFTTRAATRDWAVAFARGLGRPAVVRLEGGVGAGKTQIARWMLEALGVPESSSPTFAIHHAYSSPAGPIDHLDLYRLEKPGDLESAGFWDVLAGRDALVLVEWADRVAEDLWPRDPPGVRVVIAVGVGGIGGDRETESEARTIEVVPG